MSFCPVTKRVAPTDSAEEQARIGGQTQDVLCCSTVAPRKKLLSSCPEATERPRLRARAKPAPNQQQCARTLPFLVCTAQRCHKDEVTCSRLRRKSVTALSTDSAEANECLCCKPQCCFIGLPSAHYIMLVSNNDCFYLIRAKEP